MSILDKLVEYRTLVLRLEELRNKYGGKLTIRISPNVKITERWENPNRSYGYFEREFRLANLDVEITRLKDNIKYHEKKNEPR